MRKIITRFLSILMAALLLFASLGTGTATVYADGVDGEAEGYLVLGADLTQEQRDTVLANLGVTDTTNYNVSYSTNEQEHEAFDAYLPSSVIGTKAYSSILLIPAEEGAGISVSTSNISYVTVAMYQNALISAGVSDVTVRVTAPFSVSGTAALVGAMNAYTIMTGESIDADVSDAAVNELVTTGDLGDEIGDNDTAAEVMATLKEQVASSDDDLSEEELADAVDDTLDEFNVDVSEDTKDEMVDVLKKLQDSDALDEGTLKEQASDLYDAISDKLNSLDISSEEAGGFFRNLWNAICDFINNLLERLFGSDDAEETTAADVTEAEEIPEETQAPAAEAEDSAGDNAAGNDSAVQEATAASSDPREAMGAAGYDTGDDSADAAEEEHLFDTGDPDPETEEAAEEP